MRVVRAVSARLSDSLEVVAAVGLILMMLLTTADVIMRTLGSPIRGTLELVSFGGGLVIALAQPNAFRTHAHVSVDTFVGYLPRWLRYALHVVTRCLALGVFLIVGWSLLQIGTDMRSTGETSAVLSLSYSPLLYVMAGAFVATCLTFVHDLRDFEEGQDG